MTKLKLSTVEVSGKLIGFEERSDRIVFFFSHSEFHVINAAPGFIVTLNNMGLKALDDAIINFTKGVIERARRKPDKV